MLQRSRFVCNSARICAKQVISNPTPTRSEQVTCSSKVIGRCGPEGGCSYGYRCLLEPEILVVAMILLVELLQRQLPQNLLLLPLPIPVVALLIELIIVLVFIVINVLQVIVLEVQFVNLNQLQLPLQI